MLVNYDEKEILEIIDSTLLRADATPDDIAKLCKTAADNEFAAVIVNPVFVKKCRQLLKGTPVKVGTVIGFPLGADFTKVRVAQARQAVRAGAQDLDIVMPIYLVKQGLWEEAYKDLKKVMRACRGRTVKIIIETCYLTEEEIVKACEMCVQLKARFVKTSTGFGPDGAKVEDVQLMARAIKNAVRAASKSGTDKDLHTIEVKASGGIRTFEQARLMAEAGAKRIGTTNAAQIALEATGKTDEEGIDVREPEEEPQKEQEQEIEVEYKVQTEDAEAPDEDSEEEDFN